MKSKDIVIFHPDIYKTETDNEYTRNICRAIESKYSIKPVAWFLKHPFNSQVKCLYLNWYENPTKGKNIIEQWIRYQIKLLALRIAHFRKIHIVYVVHNKIPHTISRSSKVYNRCTKPFIKRCLGMSDVVVELCSETEKYISHEYGIKDISKKIHMLPHGKYIKYKCNPDDIREKYGISPDELLLTSVGRMDKYKNIDIIIEAFYKADISSQGKLLIAGKCDEGYRKHLEGLVKDTSVIFDFSYISDEDMSAIMQASDAVLLPYTYTSLNSGVMINAFSNGITVIGTNIGMLKDYAKDLVYGYDYTSREEHIQALADSMRRAAMDFEAGMLKEKGEALQNKMDKENDWKDIDKEIINIL